MKTRYFHSLSDQVTLFSQFQHVLFPVLCKEPEYGAEHIKAGALGKREKKKDRIKKSKMVFLPKESAEVKTNRRKLRREEIQKEIKDMGRKQKKKLSRQGVGRWVDFKTEGKDIRADI